MGGIGLAARVRGSEIEQSPSNSVLDDRASHLFSLSPGQARPVWGGGLGSGLGGWGGVRTVSAAKAGRVCCTIAIAGVSRLKVRALPADLSLLLL